jgi:NAD(P)-dependent dehydrogenase (short-subunit alcohol dehydrogenase family)
MPPSCMSSPSLLLRSRPSLIPSFPPLPRFNHSADPTKCTNYRSQTPWPRFGRVDEVGSAVLFLASDASDYCNGSDFSMDAGYNVA